MSLKKLHEEIKACKGCQLSGKKTIIVGRQKNKSKGIYPDLLFVSETPISETNLIRDAGFDSYAITSLCLCNTPKNRPATLAEKISCSKWLQEHINILGPKIIVAVGKSVIEYFLGKETEFGKIINDAKSGYRIFPVEKFGDSLQELLEITKEFSGEVAENMVILKDYTINKQIADDKGKYEMIDGTLAGLHYFANEANVMFRDINQVDECWLGDKKVKIYIRTAEQDEDMLIKERYYQANKDVEYYVLCKIKGGKYTYLGFVDKILVEQTRVVQMIGQDSSRASDDIRRMFAEQYKPMSELIPVYVEDKKEEEQIIEQNFVPLHMHTEYSIGDGFGTITKVVDALYKKGFRGASITDHGTLSGVWHFQKEMLAKGLKPIIGYEAYVKIEGEDPKTRYHLVLHVKNEVGWTNLKKLHTLAVREHFYYKPIIPLEVLLSHSEGLIATSACMQGMLNKKCSEKKYDEVQKITDRLLSAFGDDFYFEMMLHNIEDNQKTLQALHKLSQKKQIKCILTLDSHYCNKDDKKYHDALKAIAFNKKYGEAGYGDDCFYLMQSEDIIEKAKKDANWMLPYIDSWKANTLEIFDKCNFQIQYGKVNDTLPKIDFPGKTRAEALKELCIDGLHKNTPYKYEGEIKERLDLEIERILSKGYENYFLLVYRLIKWAKENGIMCGPGRGSVGASLCAYALNITECDPIEFNLLFDRFISEIRRDAPDIDMDFMDIRREEVFKHLQQEYGENNCVKVITFSRFHPKGAMRDMGRIFSVPIKEIEKINNLVIERSGGDARASFGLEDTFAEFDEAKKFMNKYPLQTDVAINLEGHIRHVGIHAAAMIVAEDDISTYVPIRRIGNEMCTEWDKQYCEDMKLVKLDILGLKTLSIIDDCVKGAKIELPRSFTDADVYKQIFHTEDTSGVFQFNSTGMTKFARGLNIEKFQDLYDATTLFRPGALHSGQAMMYANRKLGKEPVEYMHPLLEPLTNDTRGIILYQEQVMQVMNQIGGMSWAAAETVRKIITKSKGSDAFNKMREDFVRNTKKLHNMPESESQQLFDVVSTFGSYSFNKAHAVEYSIISYWCAFLKVYHPQHFYKSLLKYEGDERKIQQYMQEAQRKGILIEYPDVNKSIDTYETVDGNIYAGLLSIKGLGPKTAQKIISRRPYADFDDFKKKAKIGGKVLQGLIVADAFREFKINNKTEYEIVEDKNYVGDSNWEDSEWAQLIYKHTSLKPKVNIEVAFDFGNYPFVDICDFSDKHAGKQCFLRGIVTFMISKDKLIDDSYNKHIHQFEKRMLYVNVSDGTGDIAVVISPATFEKYKELFQKIEGQPIIALGTVAKDGKKIYGDMLQIVGEEKTTDIDDTYEMIGILKDGEAIITSAQPCVSKKGSSYYRIKLNDGTEGLYFRPSKKILVGMKVKYTIDNVFLDLEFI